MGWETNLFSNLKIERAKMQSLSFTKLFLHMVKLMDTIPTWLGCVLFVMILVGVYCTVLMALRRPLNKEILKQNHDVTGVIFNMIGILYALILAFVIVAVWEDYDEINNSVEQEANKLEGILGHTDELPDSVGKKIRLAIQDYLDKVINREWKAMEAEEVNELSGAALLEIRTITFTQNPSNKKEELVLRFIHDDISDVIDLRQERLTRNHAHVPALVWMVLIVGSIVTIIFSYLFFIEPFWLRMLSGIFLTGMIALSLFLVFMLDHPFIGSSKISAQPLINVRQDARY